MIIVVDQNGNKIKEINLKIGMKNKLDKQKCYENVIFDIKTGKMSENFSEKISEIKENDLKKLWITASEFFVRNTVFAMEFRNEWTTRSHTIRKEFNNDITLKNILWKVLPPYSGGDLKLWRGERSSRVKKNIIGFNWSTNREYVEEYFANGSYRDGRSGSCLLEVQIKSKGIISGHSNHRLDNSNSEASIVIDPKYAKNIKIVNEFKRYR